MPTALSAKLIAFDQPPSPAFGYQLRRVKFTPINSIGSGGLHAGFGAAIERARVPGENRQHAPLK
jgi:hypothetical protein